MRAWLRGRDLGGMAAGFWGDEMSRWRAMGDGMGGMDGSATVPEVRPPGDGHEEEAPEEGPQGDGLFGGGAPMEPMADGAETVGGRFEVEPR